MENPSNTSCQICLGQLELPINLFESSYSDLLDVLQLLLTFQVYVEGKKFIVCRHCQGKLIWISEFQTICLKSLEPLRNLDNKPDFSVDEYVQQFSSVISQQQHQNVPIKTEGGSSPVNQSDDDEDNNLRPASKLHKYEERVTRGSKIAITKPEIRPIGKKKISKGKIGCFIVKDDNEAADRSYSPFEDNSDVDNDYEPSGDDSNRKRKRPLRQTREKRLKPNVSINAGCIRKSKLKKKQNKASERVRSIFEQFAYSEVLQAIKDVHGAAVKNIRCILCDFIGKNEPILCAHMKKTHKVFDNWCRHCNIQVEDVQQHREAVRCNIWTCKFCKRCFPKMKELTRHLKLHCCTRVPNISLKVQQYPVGEVLQALKDLRIPADVKRRQCGLCSYVGGQVGHLKRHLYKTHIAEFTNWCIHCNTITQDLQKHKDADKCYGESCKFCNQTFTKRKFLTLHLQKHCRKELVGKLKGTLDLLGEGNDETDTSGKGSKLIDRRKASAEKAHDLGNSLCPICGKTFKTKGGADYHILTHYGDPKFKCNTCGKHFFGKNVLRNHELTHSKIKAYVCQICGKGSSIKIIHKKHMETHEGGPVQCTICYKQFPRPGVLKLHMRHHTGENKYRCIPCGKSFHIKSRLNEHMEMHNDDRSYMCTVCGNSFKSKDTLRRHKLIHTGDKRYKCSVCPFRCFQAQGLTTHMKQHPEDTPQANRPHKCQLCNKAFSTNALLMCHIEISHSDYFKK